jgi:hypothetical protein
VSIPRFLIPVVVMSLRFEVRQLVQQRCRELCMFSHSGDDIIRSETLDESICIVKGIGEDVNRRNFIPNRRSFSKLGSRQEWRHGGFGAESG